MKKIRARRALPEDTRLVNGRRDFERSQKPWQLTQPSLPMGTLFLLIIRWARFKLLELLATAIKAKLAFSIFLSSALSEAQDAAAHPPSVSSLESMLLVNPSPPVPSFIWLCRTFSLSSPFWGIPSSSLLHWNLGLPEAKLHALSFLYFSIYPRALTSKTVNPGMVFQGSFIAPCTLHRTLYTEEEATDSSRVILESHFEALGDPSPCPWPLLPATESMAFFTTVSHWLSSPNFVCQPLAHMVSFMLYYHARELLFHLTPSPKRLPTHGLPHDKLTEKDCDTKPFIFPNRQNRKVWFDHNRCFIVVRINSTQSRCCFSRF